jgi:uncharacterized coiled-coil DUF342 family protein
MSRKEILFRALAEKRTQCEEQEKKFLEINKNIVLAEIEKDQVSAKISVLREEINELEENLVKTMRPKTEPRQEKTKELRELFKQVSFEEQFFGSPCGVG